MQSISGECSIQRLVYQRITMISDGYTRLTAGYIITNDNQWRSVVVVVVVAALVVYIPIPEKI